MCIVGGVYYFFFVFVEVEFFLEYVEIILSCFEIILKLFEIVLKLLLIIFVFFELICSNGFENY